MDESCMVKLSKTCVKNFQDLPCGREFIDVAVRRLRSQSTVTTAQSTKPNRRERWQASKTKISRSVQAHERGHCGRPADVHGGHARRDRAWRGCNHRTPRR